MRDPKYGIRGEKLINKQSGEFIPEDEPVFLIRAKDIHAVNALSHYMTQVQDPEHKQTTNFRIAEFVQWAQDNPNLMGEPSTILVRTGQDDATAEKPPATGPARIHQGE